jgi:hypothetical protein
MGMKISKKAEDRPTPEEVYSFRVYFYASVASFGAATSATMALSSEEP